MSGFVYRAPHISCHPVDLSQVPLGIWYQVHQSGEYNRRVKERGAIIVETGHPSHDEIVLVITWDEAGKQVVTRQKMVIKRGCKPKLAAAPSAAA